MGEGIHLQVYVISDATGRTAESVIKAVLVQFPQIQPRVIRFSNVRHQDEILRILREADQSGGIVIYSLVNRELRDVIEEEGRRRGLLLFDLLGPIIDKVRRLFNLMPISRPGLLKHVHLESLRLAEAIEFTLKHDDGLGMETMDQAELVILGISRTSKTPTSFYLACNHLLKVANVPIVLGQQVPASIIGIDVPKVGFLIEPKRLHAIRMSRARDIPNYADMQTIVNELRYSEEVFRKIPRLRVLDVTSLSVEEIAHRVMDWREALSARGTL